MKFYLDPPSGHANSYLDVRFVAEFDKVDKAEIRLFNRTSKQEIELLSVNNGFIINETLAKCKNVDSASGYINLFNRDKMNRGLSNFTSIDITCSLVTEKDGHVETQEETVTFYNESKSLDSDIIPFDIYFEDTTVDIENGRPLTMNIVCDAERRYELSIRSEDKRKSCTFDVFTKKGITKVKLPAEVIYSDLGIKNSYQRKYDVYWTKFEGVDYEKFMNRKYVRIPNSRIRFNSNILGRKPQERKGPTGEILSKDFILSDRYFVHTWKDFSAFASKDKFDKIRLKRLAMFLPEAQAMQMSGQMEAFSSNKEETNIAKSMHHDLLMKKKRNISSAGLKKDKEFFEVYSKVYTKKSFDHKSSRVATLGATNDRQVVSKSSGGCGCSRKKS